MRNISVWLPFARPLLGTWPTTQARVLTGNQTRDPLLRRSALNPLSYTSQAAADFCAPSFLHADLPHGGQPHDPLFPLPSGVPHPQAGCPATSRCPNFSVCPVPSTCGLVGVSPV